MVATPAQAAPTDLLTISDAATGEGGDLAFTATDTAQTTSPSIQHQQPRHHQRGGRTPVRLLRTSRAGHAPITFPAATAAPPSKATASCTRRWMPTHRRAMSSSNSAVAIGLAPGTDPTVSGRASSGPGYDEPHRPERGDDRPGDCGQRRPEVGDRHRHFYEPAPARRHNSGADRRRPRRHGRDTMATLAGGVNRDYTALLSDATIVIPAYQTSGSIMVQLGTTTSTRPTPSTPPSSRTPAGRRSAATRPSARRARRSAFRTTTRRPRSASATRRELQEGLPLTYPVTLSNPSEGVTAPLTVIGQAEEALGRPAR